MALLNIYKISALALDEKHGSEASVQSILILRHVSHASDSIIYLLLFDANFTQFQLMYITGSETIANMNNDTKASNESTNMHRIAIHYTGYSEGSAVL